MQTRTLLVWRSIRAPSDAEPPALKTENSNRTRALPIRKKLIFAIATTSLVFFALECLLALFGVQPTLVDRDPFVGFESSIPLFVEHRHGDEVVLRTAANKLSFFNAQSFTRD